MTYRHHSRSHGIGQTASVSLSEPWLGLPMPIPSLRADAAVLPESSEESAAGTGEASGARDWVFLPCTALGGMTLIAENLSRLIWFFIAARWALLW